MPLVICSVVNVTADINDFHLISFDTSRVSREEVVNCLLWGRYSSDVKFVVVVISSFICCKAEEVELLLFAFRDLWKEWGDSNFQIFFHITPSSTTGGWSHWNI